MSKGPQILTVNPVTKKVTNLSKQNFDDMDPSFSPNGTTVLFVSDGSIYTMTPSGTSRTNLTPGNLSLEDPAWSANGSQVVYDENGDIGIMNANGTGQHLLTHTGDDSQADWSPDGTLIAFYRDANGVAEVFTITPKGTGLKDLSAVTDPQHNYYDNEPAWAPDSQHLLVTSDRAAGGNQIFEMSRNGTTVQPVTDAYDGPDSPVFSPDSTSIAYTADNGQGTNEVFTQPLGGTGVPITSTEVNSITGHLSWQAKVTTRLNVKPVSAAPGATFTVTLSGYGADEPVPVSFIDGSMTTELGATTTTTLGSGSIRVTVPAGATPGTATVTGTGQNTARTASHAFTVTS